jgi:hypothetical protein
MITPEQLMTKTGRSMKFTPERLEQIKNLVERGMSREEVAETIGVTLGSLQVTCSRRGISLRRPKQITGLTTPKRRTLVAPQFQQGDATMSEDDNQPLVKISVRLEYKGMAKNIEIPLSNETVGRLALEASMHNCTVGELLAVLIVDGLAREANKDHG